MYERSRFEGSTTNHFAYPLVLAVTGRHVRQPIAGDFAFGARLLDLLENIDLPEVVQQYGIDIYLTLAVLMNGLRHQQVTLGRKVHGPSFHKLEYMFPQIAAAALYLLRQAPLRTSVIQSDRLEGAGIIPVSVFSHRDSAKAMRARAQSILRSAKPDTWGWVPADTLRKCQETHEAGISLDYWLDVLMSWLRFGLKDQRVSTDLLGEHIVPFFVLRATNFWFCSEQMTAEETELEIRRQARLLHTRFQHFLLEATNRDTKPDDL